MVPRSDDLEEMMEWPVKGSAKKPLRGNSLSDWNAILQEAIIFIKPMADIWVLLASKLKYTSLETNK